MRRLAFVFLALLALAPRPSSGAATLWLAGSSPSVTQTGDTVWTLDKDGSRSGDLVTWEITASEEDSDAGLLLVAAQLTLVNSGSDPATIGNIVVNLQKRRQHLGLGLRERRGRNRWRCRHQREDPRRREL